MSVLAEVLKIAAGSKIAEAIWQRIVEGQEPATIPLGELLSDAQLNRMRRAAALDRARLRRGRP